MIYLIDDKKIRQGDLGWSQSKLDKYKNEIVPLYDYKDVERIKKEMFEPGNIILYHESFYDNPQNAQNNDSRQVKNMLIKYAEKEYSIVIFFSGSIAGRTIEGNIGSLHVDIVYQNLNYLLEQYVKDRQSVTVMHIVYGKNFQIEEILRIKTRLWSLLYNMSDDEVLPIDIYKIKQVVTTLAEMLSMPPLTFPMSIGYFKYLIQKSQSEKFFIQD